ncbi:hypothetical protein BJ085DRAFT_28852 [Dimargaris cristalligena]|uniref:Mitochondrial outer membrane transport complex Sam37/metaxin N-terminal domain-containing protein n=1 Tax=Dimargaris cristalligena TaxID=215637 RepID=A0A4P9ZM34_9FUNG|nr:hypothetical protein BJ085DRAFT_28852 [Dimargaris cristalligena]|eukprot:RKP34376.1 hypothetical protein BJ085DRAFT_28852 [Dimargaris cristalligena]
MASPLSPIRSLLNQLAATSFPLKTFPIPQGTSTKADQESSNGLVLYCYGPGFQDDVTSFDPPSLRWLAYLTFLGLEFRTVYCNEPLKAPNGRLPYLLTADRQCIADEDILDYLRTHYDQCLPALDRTLTSAASTSTPADSQTTDASGKPTDSPSSDPDAARQRALLALLENQVDVAVRYYFWCEPANFREQTRYAYGGHYPWPVNHIEPWLQQCQKTRQVAAHFSHRGLVQPEEIYRSALTVLQALADHLGDHHNPYFFTKSATTDPASALQPSLLDATLFAYMFPVLSATMPRAQFKTMVKEEAPRIEEFVRNIWDRWFKTGLLAQESE